MRNQNSPVWLALIGQVKRSWGAAKTGLLSGYVRGLCLGVPRYLSFRTGGRFMESSSAGSKRGYQGSGLMDLEIGTAHGSSCSNNLASSYQPSSVIQQS